MNLSIIIPTLNERGSLPLLFDELIPVFTKLKDNDCQTELIIVDDNSDDGTQQFIKDFSQNSPFPIKLIERKERGLATAVIRGFEESNSELLCVMDADLSHPPNLIPKLVENSKCFDVVLPCRNMPGGGAEEWPIHRKLTSMLATSLVKFVGIKARDPMSGFFLIHKKVIDGVELNPIGYKILIEILVKGNYKNFIEVPYIFRNRTTGSSKMSNIIIWQYLKHLWYLKKWSAK
ncbi:MAG: polyprenol monophosphomannose synthase [bacterium]|nr:polyprenol monophosphomannose synthase [bacterium]